MTIANCISYMNGLTNFKWLPDLDYKSDFDIGVWTNFAYPEDYIRVIELLHKKGIRFQFIDKMVFIGQKEITKHSRESKLNEILN